MAGGRCVIRCNVNNLLLAVVVIESALLGIYFLSSPSSPLLLPSLLQHSPVPAEALQSAPGLGELPSAGADGEDASVRLPFSLHPELSLDVVSWTE